MNAKNIGSSFDSWLREEGIYEECNSGAMKRLNARLLEAEAREINPSKNAMDNRMEDRPTPGRKRRLL